MSLFWVFLALRMAVFYCGALYRPVRYHPRRLPQKGQRVIGAHGCFWPRVKRETGARLLARRGRNACAAPATVSARKACHAATGIHSREGDPPVRPSGRHSARARRPAGTRIGGCAAGWRRRARFVLLSSVLPGSRYVHVKLPWRAGTRGMAKGVQPMKIRIPAVVAAIAAAFPCAASAQSSTPQMSEVVVTATRTARTADETLAAVTVITREDIERQQARSVSDLFRGLPGITVGNSGGRGKATSVF